MFTVINTATSETRSMNYMQLCKLVEEDLDETFFGDLFSAHTLDTPKSKLLVMEE